MGKDGPFVNKTGPVINLKDTQYSSSLWIIDRVMRSAVASDFVLRQMTTRCLE